MMKPTLLRGVVAALFLSLVGAAVFAAVRHVSDPNTAIRIVIALTAGGYLAWLVSTSGIRIGRITTVIAWSTASVALWFTGAPLTLYLLGHVFGVWLIRSLYFHTSVIPALVDLGLGALAIGAALWAIEQTGSVFLAGWCFFLVQAFFVLIPELSDQPSCARPHSRLGDSNSTFKRAQRTADAALRRISASN